MYIETPTKYSLKSTLFFWNHLIIQSIVLPPIHSLSVYWFSYSFIFPNFQFSSRGLSPAFASLLHYVWIRGNRWICTEYTNSLDVKTPRLSLYLFTSFNWIDWVQTNEQANVHRTSCINGWFSGIFCCQFRLRHIIIASHMTRKWNYTFLPFG